MMVDVQTDSCKEEAPEHQPGLMAFLRVTVRVAVSAALGTALWLVDLRVYGDTGPLPDIVASWVFGAWCGAAAGLIWGPIIEVSVPDATERQRWLVTAGSMAMMCVPTAVLWAVPPAGLWWGLRLLVVASLAAAVVEAVALVWSVRTAGPPTEHPSDAA